MKRTLSNAARGDEIQNARCGPHTSPLEMHMHGKCAGHPELPTAGGERSLQHVTSEAAVNQTQRRGHSLANRRLFATGSIALLFALGCSSGFQGSSDSDDAAPITTKPVAGPSTVTATAPAAMENPAVSSPAPGASPPSVPAAPIAAAPAAPVPPAPASARTCDDSVTFDDLYTQIEADQLSEDAADRVFLRYVSLTNRINQGICPEDLATDRAALIKALNSLSTEPTIALPEPIDADRTLYRIDLRDLGWDQPVSVEGVAFTDKWEAIAAASPFAVEFEGDQADATKLNSGTRVPVIQADALMDEALTGELYYAILNVGESEDDLLAQLGIDEDAQEAQKIVIRAGTSRSRLSRQDTVAERLQVETFQGYYWARYDLAAATAGQSIFDNPLGFQEDSIEAVFSLPNGLNGYVIFDGAGVRQTETNVVSDPTQPDGRVRNSVSCSQCHAAGLNAITDEVRAYVEANAVRFDADTFGEVQDSFPVQSELDATLQEDRAIYLAALSRAGVDATAVDPVDTVYVRFDGDVTLGVAAGDLGVRADDLSRELGLLSSQVDSTLSVLSTGSLTRDQFEELYLATLCALQISSDNRPVAAACGTVGQ
jgi:hypothetical protein